LKTLRETQTRKKLKKTILLLTRSLYELNALFV
jgi:hypothetical protein